MKNKPWKTWKTRKFSFIYCVSFGTIIIIFGAIMIGLNISGFDTATWFSNSLDFCKFIIGTGTALILVPNIKDFIKLVISLFNGSADIFSNENIDTD